jgi:hypothetical protein
VGIAAGSTSFRFQAGSCGGLGEFLPSIACLKRDPGTFAQRLREFGYVSVTDFRVIAENSRKGIGFVPAVDPDE